MRNYKVKAKCGHVGRGRYIPITFYLIANDKDEAATIVRKIPRVKHDEKSAIMEVVEITDAEYRIGVIENESNPYLLCKNHQDQIKIMDEIRELIVYENTNEFDNIEPMFSLHKKHYNGKIELRCAKKYINRYLCMDYCDVG